MLRRPPRSPLFPSPTLFRSPGGWLIGAMPAFGLLATCRPPGPSLARGDRPASRKQAKRSEEHTSELQSQSNLVCRLLLEKKKHVGGRLTGARSATTAPPDSS